MRNRTLNFVLLLVMVSSLGITQPAAAVGPETWYVSSTAGNDANTCNTVGTPCLTINAAINQSADGDTVKVSVGIYAASSGTEVVFINKGITLSGGWVETFITQDGMSTIDGGEVRRGIVINTGVSAIINNFLIQNTHFDGDGSAIYNQGSLILNKSLISDNYTKPHPGYVIGGGVIYNTSVLEINDSAIINNAGRGIESYGTLVLFNSRISNNTYGGVGVIGETSINNSEVSFNSLESYGGGVYSRSGTLKINNSTVSGNKAGWGVRAEDNVIIRNSTITNNTPGGVASYSSVLENTIVAGNYYQGNEGDCAGNITSYGNNLIGNTGYFCNISSYISDQIGAISAPINPKLAPLADNGGFTKTHALYSASSAVDAGDPLSCPPEDQRGVARPVGAACDIGAFEGSIQTLTPYIVSPLTGQFTTDNTPAFKWEVIPEATEYELKLMKNSELVYLKSVFPASCNSICTTTPTTEISPGVYAWQVHAFINGEWKEYTESQHFTVSPAKAGFWSSRGLKFYVKPTEIPTATTFVVKVYVGGCNKVYVVKNGKNVNIIGKSFSFPGSFYIKGTFSSPTKVKGTLGFRKYYIKGCGYISGGPFTWSATWKRGGKIDPDFININDTLMMDKPLTISITP